MKGHFFHKKELIDKMSNIIGKTLGDVDINNVFNKTIDKPKITGIAGDVIEQSVLGFPADNLQRPDLDVDGFDVELKTTGIRYSSKDPGVYEAKEPMSITAVSPDKIPYENFHTSNFWHKLEHLLIVYYHYDSKKTVIASEYEKFYIRGFEFHEFNEEDKARLQNDWEIVRRFIENVQNEYEDPQSQYPRISTELRKELVYIDTAPKWPNSPRFRLKRHVVTNMVQAYFGQKLEKLPDLYNGYSDIDKKCQLITNKDSGSSVKELIIKYKILKPDMNKIAKSINEEIVVKMFGGHSKKMNQIELFTQFEIVGKSITLSINGKRTEDMKLFPIDFDEWSNENISFEESSIYEFFAYNQFLCILFKEDSVKSKLSENRFVGFKRLYFDDVFIQTHVRKVWDEVRRLIWENRLEEKEKIDKCGNRIVNKKTKTVKTEVNFPKSKNNVVFLRGSGIDSNNKIEEVNGIKMYRQFVWIKGSYIVELLEELK